MSRERRTSQPPGLCPSKPGKGDSGPEAPSSGGATPRYVLPSDLSASLRHLDDMQLDTLLQAAAVEARRRGPPAGADAPAPPAVKKEPGRDARPPSGAKVRPAPVTTGQARILRAAFEAGVKPAALARQFRLSRAQVERIVGAAKRDAR